MRPESTTSCAPPGLLRELRRIDSRQRPARRASTAATSCCCARTTTSAWRATRACAPPPPRPRSAGAPAPARRGWSAARSRCTSSSRRSSPTTWAPRRACWPARATWPTSPCVTALTEPGEVDPLRRAQPRLDHRRLPARRARETVVYDHLDDPGDGRRHDRHRRGLLDGRRRRADLAALRGDRRPPDRRRRPPHRRRRPGRVDADVIVGTLSKALGSYGAFIGCDARDARAADQPRAPDHLLHRAAARRRRRRPRRAARSCATEPERMARLHANARVLREAVGAPVERHADRPADRRRATRRRSPRPSARSSRASSPRRSARRPSRTAPRACASSPAPTTTRTSCAPPVRCSASACARLPARADRRLRPARPPAARLRGRARRRRARHGFAVLEREPGGHAAAYAPRLARHRARGGGRPRRHPRALRARRRHARRAPSTASASTRASAPSPDEYCAGDYSVNLGGRAKLAGLAQRVRGGRYMLGANLDRARTPSRVRAVLTDVYAALDLPFDPATSARLDRRSTTSSGRCARHTPARDRAARSRPAAPHPRRRARRGPQPHPREPRRARARPVDLDHQRRRVPPVGLRHGQGARRARRDRPRLPARVRRRGRRRRVDRRASRRWRSATSASSSSSASSSGCGAARPAPRHQEAPRRATSRTRRR